MKKLIIFTILLFILGCKIEEISPEIEKGFLQNQLIFSGGIDRSYHIYVPNDPTNASVVLLFHGNGGNYDDILGLSGIKAPYKVWLDLALEEN